MSSNYANLFLFIRLPVVHSCNTDCIELKRTRFVLIKTSKRSKNTSSTWFHAPSLLYHIFSPMKSAIRFGLTSWKMNSWVSPWIQHREEESVENWQHLTYHYFKECFWRAEQEITGENVKRIDTFPPVPLNVPVTHRVQLSSLLWHKHNSQTTPMRIRHLKKKHNRKLLKECFNPKVFSRKFGQTESFRENSCLSFTEHLIKCDNGVVQ